MSAKWVKRRLGAAVQINPKAEPLPAEFVYIDLESVKDGELQQRKVISRIDAPSRAQRTLRTGDVLFQLVRPYQQNNLFFEPQDGADYVASTGYGQIRTEQEPRYFYYSFHRTEFLYRVLALCTGTGYPAIAPSELSKIVICYPSSTDEQRRIAEILSTCDEVITRSRAVVEKLRKIKAGMLNDFFTRGIGTDGQLRPTLQQAPKLYKDSTLGAIPEDWEVKRLGDVCEVQLGKMLDAAKNVGVERPYLGNKAVQWGRFDLSAVEKVRLTEDDLRRFRLQKDDLLVCEGGEVGRCAIWNDELPECYYQKAIHRVRLLNSQNGSVVFLANVFAWYAANDRFRPYVTQTSIAHLPKEKLEEVLIAWPEKSEQDRIAERLAAMDERIVAEERVIAKYRFVKAGLMQRLLAPPTGAEIVDGTNREAV